MGAKPASMHRAIRQGFGVLLNGMGAKRMLRITLDSFGFGVLLNGRGAKQRSLSQSSLWSFGVLLNGRGAKLHPSLVNF